MKEDYVLLVLMREDTLLASVDAVDRVGCIHCNYGGGGN